VPVLLAAAVLFSPPVPADEAQDVKAAIVVRCYYAVGEFGAELVDRCVKDDTAAEQALKHYPAEAKTLIQACTDRVGGDGFARIQACVDQGVQSGSGK